MAIKPVDLCSCLPESSKFLEASIELSHKISPGGLSNTLLSEECVLEKVPVVRSVGRTQTSKDRGKGGDPPVAQVLVVGPAAMSSQ